LHQPHGCCLLPAQGLFKQAAVFFYALGIFIIINEVLNNFKKTSYYRKDYTDA